jgi:hypothetical protein
MRRLKGWEDSTFDLILHAETCYRKGSDFDRRIALILFDNSIETAIITHLNLHPDQRKNVRYTNAEVDVWSKTFHSKLDFLFNKFIADNGCSVSFERADLIHCHDIRNGQYHGGTATIPRARDLEDIKSAAIEIFSILFDFPDVIDLLEIKISELDPTKEFPKRTRADDKLIDEEFGTIRIAGQTYYTSEAIYGVDPFAYGNVAANLKAGIKPSEGETEEI